MAIVIAEDRHVYCFNGGDRKVMDSRKRSGIWYLSSNATPRRFF